MFSLFKKSVLSVAMLGCVLGMQAEEKKAASSGAALLATGGMVAGAAVTALGAAGLYAKVNMNEIVQDCAPSFAAQWLSISPYAWLIVPGGIAALAGMVYCSKSAKGITKKIRSNLGSLVAIAGGALLAAGCMVYFVGNKQHILAGNGIKSVVNDLRNGKSLASIVNVQREVIEDAAWYFEHPNQHPLGLEGSDTFMQISYGAGIVGGLMALLGYAIQPTDNGEKKA